MNTGALKTFLEDEKNGFEKSDKPKKGDIVLWRSSSKGHTGIVSDVAKDGTFTIVHARGTKYGTVENKGRKKTSSSSPFVGFFRPKNEKEKKKEETASTDVNSGRGYIADLQALHVAGKKKALEEQRKRELAQQQQQKRD